MMQKTLLWGLGLTALGAGVLYAMSGKKALPAGRVIDPTVTPVVPAGTTLALLGDPLNLKSQQYYRGRLDLRPDGLPPFRMAADEVELGKGLSALGFQDVRVHMSQAALPEGWTPDSLQNVGTNTRWFSGMWSGLTAPFPRPRELSMMWPTRSPAAVAAAQERV